MHPQFATLELASAALTYPFELKPQPGEARQVVEGVYWLRMPLPIVLNHVNVWAVRDGDGWTLVDTGMHTPETEQAWLGALQTKPVRRVIATHMHPDHIGLAGWLTRRFDCRLWMTRLEYVTCRMLVADTGREAPEDALRFYHAAGWGRDALDHYRARFGGFGRMVHTLPDSYRRVTDRDSIDIDGRTWQAVVGRGHSPEHLCLYNPELKTLISGDQVLPKITSNVSVFPTEPDADPLTDWLESLAEIQRRVPDDVLVLPSHNTPFHGLHTRLAQLVRGHEEKLERLLAELGEPKRAIDTVDVLFSRRVGIELLSMATGESLAHLHCLMRRGLVLRETDGTGVSWYRRS